MIWPGLAIVICVLAINLAGDALRDALSKQDSHE
jgi:peptide/nickel transport system permease protein